jgi:hypothetical protein
VLLKFMCPRRIKIRLDPRSQLAGLREEN